MDEHAERYARAAADLGDGEICALFNNAVIEGPVVPIERLAPEDFDRVIAVDVRGVYLGLRNVLPFMREGGAVVNTGSGASVRGMAGAVPYVASKHAVLGMTRSVAIEVARRGIRVNTVLPGPSEGRMMTSFAERTAYGTRRIASSPRSRSRASAGPTRWPASSPTCLPTMRATSRERRTRSTAARRRSANFYQTPG